MTILRLIVGSVVSAAVLMAWGMLFWMVLPFGELAIHPLPDGDRLGALLHETIPETGSYVWPMPEGGQQQPAGEGDENGAEPAAMSGRPFIHVFYSQEGSDPNGPTMYGLGFAHFAGTSLLVGCLLWFANLKWYISRVGLTVLSGVMAIWWQNFGDVIWWHHSCLYHVVLGGFELVGAVLMGLVMAAFVGPLPKKRRKD